MNGFRLGSVLGFEIRIDRSWFIIFFLILWSFTMGVFPAVIPGYALGAYLAMGTVATLLFFASIVAHELSHALVARTRGIPVEGITLFIFGGIAHTRMEFERPRDELLVAGVGPLSSLLIGLLFGAVVWVGQVAGWPAAVTVVAWHLALINVVLAVFNLLPGFPLDGGRIFRAVAWHFTGSSVRATRMAATGGRWLGYLLMAFGVLQLFAGNLLGGLWMIFIGWFVRGAAEASYLQHVLMRTLEGVRAREVMSPHPDTVPAGATLEEFLEDHVLRGRHHGYPVLEDGHPVGIVTLQRVKEIPREEWGRTTVREAMVPLGEGMRVRPEESMSTVMDRLGGSGAGRVLVARDGELLGIITRSDLARWMERAQLVEEYGLERR